MSTNFLQELFGLLDMKGVLLGNANTERYCLDQRGRYLGAALAVAKPRNTEEVVAIVQLCARHGVPIVPQGGNTSLCGAATPDASSTALVMSFERMNRIIAVDAGNNTLTVEAGVLLADTRAAARDADRLFAADWGASGSCQIGGALATNAGGLNVLRYGNMRELTLGLEVVLASGEVWDGLRGLRKDNTGYDLKQLFIGSEGTLGLITKAVFRLHPLPTAGATAFVADENPQAAVDLLRNLQHRVGDRVTSFELLTRPCFDLLAKHCRDIALPFTPAPDWCVLLEVSDCGDAGLLTDQLVEALVDLGCEDAVVAQSETQIGEFWRLREAIPEAQRREGVSIKHDISVPVSRIPGFLTKCASRIRAAFPEGQIVAFGHLGDGNLHYNVFLTERSKAAYVHEPALNEIIYHCVAEENGSISAEHGIGQLKREALARYRPAIELQMMKSVKAALDPQGLMNPGKVL